MQNAEAATAAAMAATMSGKWQRPHQMCIQIQTASKLVTNFLTRVEEFGVLCCIATGWGPMGLRGSPWAGRGGLGKVVLPLMPVCDRGAVVATTIWPKPHIRPKGALGAPWEPMAGDTTSENHRPLQKDITKNTKLVLNFTPGGHCQTCPISSLACFRLFHNRKALHSHSTARPTCVFYNPPHAAKLKYSFFWKLRPSPQNAMLAKLIRRAV